MGVKLAVFEDDVGAAFEVGDQQLRLPSQRWRDAIDGSIPGTAGSLSTMTCLQ